MFFFGVATENIFLSANKNDSVIYVFAQNQLFTNNSGKP